MEERQAKGWTVLKTKGEVVEPVRRCGSGKLKRVWRGCMGVTAKMDSSKVEAMET